MLPVEGTDPHVFSLVPISGNKGCETEGARFADMLCHDFIQRTDSQVSLYKNMNPDEKHSGVISIISQKHSVTATVSAVLDGFYGDVFFFFNQRARTSSLSFLAKEIKISFHCYKLNRPWIWL